MKVGDMVRNLNSESRMTGIVVGWSNLVNGPDGDGYVGRRAPIVQWADGRCNWVLPHRVELMHESR